MNFLLIICRLLVELTRFRSTAVGLRVKDGVVLGAEKIILSKMLVEGSNKRIAHIDRHIGLVSDLLSLTQCRRSSFL